MDFRDLVTLYFERTNAMQTLWGLYLTIVLGLLGFLGTVKLKPPRLRIISLLLIAFCAFAYVNCDALRSVTSQRNILVTLIRQSSGPVEAQEAIYAKNRKQIADSLDPPSVAAVVGFHIAGDALTVFAILLLGLQHRVSAAKD